MAEKLVQYFKHVVEKNGVSGRVKLARLTNTPSIDAALKPDSPELITIFTMAVQEITGKPAPKF